MSWMLHRSKSVLVFAATERYGRGIILLASHDLVIYLPVLFNNNKTIEVQYNTIENNKIDKLWLYYCKWTHFFQNIMPTQANNQS